MGGEPIPERQLPWRGRLLPHPPKRSWSYPVLAFLSKCCPEPQSRLPTLYSPVRHCTICIATDFSFDLHVLSTPPAFVLSQDQTLRKAFTAPACACAASFEVSSKESHVALTSFLACYLVFKERANAPVRRERVYNRRRPPCQVIFSLEKTPPQRGRVFFSEEIWRSSPPAAGMVAGVGYESARVDDQRIGRGGGHKGKHQGFRADRHDASYTAPGTTEAEAEITVCRVVVVAD